MPFTLSHPAAILPFCPLLGRFAVFSALIIGSMAPDFPYFVGKPWPRIYTHTFESVFWFSLPVGWAAYLLFEYVLRRALWFLLPHAFRVRLSPKPAVGDILPVSVCLIVGALTHIAWDAFTHSSGAFVQAFPFLQLHWVTLGDYPVWSYKVLQHGSSLLGGLILMVSILRWLRRTPPLFSVIDSSVETQLRRAGRLLLMCGPIIAGLTIGFIFSPPQESVRSIARFIAYIILSGIGTTLILLILLSIWLRMRSSSFQEAQTAS